MREPQENPRIVQAAQWLAEQQEPPRLAVPTLKQEFSLNASEACEAIRLAQQFRTVRRAFG